MRILYLGNNWLGWQILMWLREQGEQVVGLVVHPEERSKYRKELIEAANLAPSQIFDGAALNQPETLEAIDALQPDLGISVLFGYILKPPVLNLCARGFINLHTSYLPYNRGAHPNVWSIVERTPAGVTLHVIDEGVDTGPIIARQQVPVEPVDTGKTLYHKLERAALVLFKETWPAIRQGTQEAFQQEPDAGTVHRMSDLEKIDRLDLDASYVARDLINILRARTFSPYPGAYFEEDGRKVYLRLELLDESELANQRES